jgi:hypothetical protein
MKKRTRYRMVALALTVIDAAVALRYGGAIWAAWSGDLWTRLVIFVLAGVWATTLAKVWAYASGFRCPARALPLNSTSVRVEAQGEADV